MQHQCCTKFNADARRVGGGDYACIYVADMHDMHAWQFKMQHGRSAEGIAHAAMRLVYRVHATTSTHYTCCSCSALPYRCCGSYAGSIKQDVIRLCCLTVHVQCFMNSGVCGIAAQGKSTPFMQPAFLHYSVCNTSLACWPACKKPLLSASQLFWSLCVCCMCSLVVLGHGLSGLPRACGVLPHQTSHAVVPLVAFLWRADHNFPDW